MKSCSAIGSLGGAAACALAAALAASPLGAQPPPPHAEHRVVIDGMAFVPPRLSVRLGDRVVFVNRDLVPHTATARDGGFDSGRIAPGASWALTASRRGRVPYVCTLHPTMAGLLVVE